MSVLAGAIKAPLSIPDVFIHRLACCAVRLGLGLGAEGAPNSSLSTSWWGWLPGVLQIQQGEEISISVTAITMSGQMCFSWCWLGVWHQKAQILACGAGRAQVCSAQGLRCLLPRAKEGKGRRTWPL